jgi:putative ABC transport system permease protein
MILLKIALRNLVEHKVKTLIIGLLISFGIFFLVTGNSFLDTITAGMKTTYIDNFTGDLIVHGKTKGTFSLFGVTGPEKVVTVIPNIPEYAKVRDFIKSIPKVKAQTSIGTASAMVSVDNESAGLFIIWGIEPDKYRSLFNKNLVLHEGEFPKEGTSEILLSQYTVQAIQRECGKTVKPGDKILLTGITAQSGFKIREVTISGIYTYKQTSMQLDRVSLVNIDTLRMLTGMILNEEKPVMLSEDEQILFEENNEDALFSNNIITNEDAKSGSSSIDFDNILGEDKGPRITARSDSNAFHFILIKCQDEASALDTKNQLEKFISQNKLEISISDWRWGAGYTAQLALGLQIVFNVVILIIFIVAIIIIMNTLVISITERIPEIGMIRAIGGRKKFVRRMIILETIVISLIFGTLGICLGAGFIALLNLLGIQADNMYLRILFGGNILKPTLSLSAVIGSLFALLMIGVLASLYPISIALKINPVKAMQKG